MTNLNNSKENENSLVQKEELDHESQNNSRFQEDLKEIRNMQKKKHKEFCKANGIQTSSDEESEKEGVQNCADLHQVKELGALPKKLPSNMQKIKQSRLLSQQTLAEIKSSKKLEYYNQVENHGIEFKKCPENCKDCIKHTKKTEGEENMIIPKRLCKEMQRVKDSKALMTKSVQELRESYKKDVKRAIPGSTFENNFKNDFTGQKNKGKLEEDEDLRRALQQSLQDTKQNNLDDIYDSDDDEEDDMLQKAINLSIAEQEKKDFSALSDLDAENVHISFAKQLSLEETDMAESKLDFSSQNECCICLESKILLYFKPCNHRIICCSCADQYTSQICPICGTYYTTISHH